FIELLARRFEVAIQPDTVAQLRYGPSACEGHQFQIRLVLVGRALDHFGHKFAGMCSADMAELVKGCKEVIVSGLRARHEIAHRKAVDHSVLERVICLRKTRIYLPGHALGVYRRTCDNRQRISVYA